MSSTCFLAGNGRLSVATHTLHSPKSLGLRPLPARDLPWEEFLAALAAGVRATARRHPAAFPLLLARPAVTPAATGVRDAVHRALRQAGVPDTNIARTERLLSTTVLGFAVSEDAGQFRVHDEDVIDADFAELQHWLRRLLSGAASQAATPP